MTLRLATIRTVFNFDFAMFKPNVCFWFSSLSIVIGSIFVYRVLCESEEQEPIPELNDFEEAYALFEYAKTTYNPFAYLPSISTTNKEIAEYLLLRGGVSKWRRPTLSVNRGPVDKPACAVHRIRKDGGSIKHELFQEKNIKIKKEFGTYEEHTVNFQYNWGAPKRRIEMLKCPCVLGGGSRTPSERKTIKSYFIDENELKLIEKDGKKVKLLIVPTTKIFSRSTQIASNKSRDDELPSIDEYPYHSSEEDSIRAPSIRLREKVSGKRLLDRDICMQGHVFLSRGVNGDNSFFVFARDRGFLRVVAHLVLK